MIVLWIVLGVYLALGLWIACSASLAWWARPLAVVLWGPWLIAMMIESGRNGGIR